MKNEKGFTTVMLLTLLPLLLTSLAVISGAYLLLEKESAAKHICRTELLRTQGEAAAQLEELLDLNMEATELRTELTMAELEVEASPITGAVHMEAVMAKQAALHTRQMALLTKGKLLSRAGAQASLMKVRAALGDAQGLSTHATQGDFDVLSAPPTSITPDYYPAPGFSRTQEIEMTWSCATESILPDWLKPWIKGQGLVSRGSCSATLTKEGSSWAPKLTKAKS